MLISVVHVDHGTFFCDVRGSGDKTRTARERLKLCNDQDKTCHTLENKTRATGIELVCRNVQPIRQLLEVEFVAGADELWISREVCCDALYAIFCLAGKSNIDSSHDTNTSKSLPMILNGAADFLFATLEKGFKTRISEINGVVHFAQHLITCPYRLWSLRLSLAGAGLTYARIGKAVFW